jgi:hypothetical protein
MKISASSALVLNWTDNRLYTGSKVKRYISSLDLSEGNEMLNHFQPDQHYMHTQTVSGRKWFMMRETTNFIDDNKAKGLSSQVIIPGAGIAPFSAAVAESYPDSGIYDIDVYNMEAKSQLLKNEFTNIEFITADLEDVEKWTSLLLKSGYDLRMPGIMVLEGITYYLTKPTLAAILRWAFENKITVIGEFGFPPDMVIPEHREYPRRVFDVITSLSNHPGVSFYTREEFIHMAKEAGYTDVTLTPMREMQILRTGEARPFEKENACWIEPFRLGDFMATRQ